MLSVGRYMASAVGVRILKKGLTKSKSSLYVKSAADDHVDEDNQYIFLF